MPAVETSRKVSFIVMLGSSFHGRWANMESWTLSSRMQAQRSMDPSYLSRRSTSTECSPPQTRRQQTFLTHSGTVLFAAQPCMSSNDSQQRNSCSALHHPTSTPHSRSKFTRAAQSRQLPSAPQFLVHFFLTLIDYCIYSVYTDEQLDCHLAIRSSPNVPPDHGADPPESGR